LDGIASTCPLLPFRLRQGFLALTLALALALALIFPIGFFLAVWGNLITFSI
jgi:hypothetical protein